MCKWCHGTKLAIFLEYISIAMKTIYILVTNSWLRISRYVICINNWVSTIFYRHPIITDLAIYGTIAIQINSMIIYTIKVIHCLAKHTRTIKKIIGIVAARDNIFIIAIYYLAIRLISV